jgi:hypothetical protein
MKTTETILLIGLGGVIAYLALSRKSGSPATKSLGGGGGGGSFEEPSTRALETVDVIETQAPINVTVNTPQAPAPETPPPPPPTSEPEDVPVAPTAAFVNSRRRQSEGYAERFVILDNTNFPLTRAYNGDGDVDDY